MFKGKVSFSAGAALIFLGCLTGFASSFCCDHNDFPWIGCKTYGGSCNIFCCNCDEACIEDDCDYRLNVTTKIDTGPEERISNVLHCDTTSNNGCSMKFTVEKTFEFSLNVSIEKTIYSVFKRLVTDEISVAFHADVADRTTTGFEAKCSLPPRSKGWLSQEPQYAALNGKYVHVCKNGTIVLLKPFEYRKPLVFEPSGLNVADLWCRVVSGNGESRRIKAHVNNGI